MEIIYGINRIKRYSKPVVTLGVFDGVHLGHTLILKETLKKAKAIGGTSIVVTFHPHPQGQKSIYSLRHRLRILEELGIDVCVVIRFDSHFARIKPTDFIRKILIAKLGPTYILVGKNFRFGRDAQGNVSLLKTFSLEGGYRLKLFETRKINQHSISSTYIRKLITQGRLALAKRLLGRPVSILGKVIRGTSVAKKLGFPTANINPYQEVLPPSGIYLVNVIVDKKRLNGLCYIGKRPTFALQDTETYITHIEVHILDFHKNIYKKELEVMFIKKIREEKRFPSSQSLVAQIRKDVITARRFFSSLKNYPNISTSSP
ncbi:MAG: bifunctional riboflavin kinase/FAD synthetase [Candidatus Omnitrophica bacterium]|nr:bifunctional riboflavin kinase/FAD synthetase [Candidatus Omnitrophota bacterium]